MERSIRYEGLNPVSHSDLLEILQAQIAHYSAFNTAGDYLLAYELIFSDLRRVLTNTPNR